METTNPTIAIAYLYRVNDYFNNFLLMIGDICIFYIDFVISLVSTYDKYS